MLKCFFSIKYVLVETIERFYLQNISNFFSKILETENRYFFISSFLFPSNEKNHQKVQIIDSNK